jgi:hypothetical protein
MKTEFNDWWNKDLWTEDNPYVEGTPAFWAWEGWSFGVNSEREACAKVAQETICDTHIPTNVNIYGTRAAKAIRARGIK